MAFLCLVNGPDGNPDVSIVHRLLRFVDSPGIEPTGFNDRVLGLLGDIMPHQYPAAVDIPNTIYHLVGPPVRVPTVAAMEALIPTWADPRAVPLGQFTEEDPETEVIRPRNTQLIPGKYASLIIHRQRMTPNRPTKKFCRCDQGGRSPGTVQRRRDLVTRPVPLMGEEELSKTCRESSSNSTQ